MMIFYITGTCTFWCLNLVTILWVIYHSPGTAAYAKTYPLEYMWDRGLENKVWLTKKTVMVFNCDRRISTWNLPFMFIFMIIQHLQMIQQWRECCKSDAPKSFRLLRIVFIIKLIIRQKYMYWFYGCVTYYCRSNDMALLNSIALLKGGITKF